MDKNKAWISRKSGHEQEFQGVLTRTNLQNLITIIAKNCTKIKDFRSNFQKFGEEENTTFQCGGECAIFVPSLKEKPEEWAKHWQNEQIE